MQAAVQEQREALREDLRALVSTPRRAQMLEAGSLSSSPSVLAKRYTNGEASQPSRDAGTFTSRGWYEKKGVTYDRTRRGKILSSGYNRLSQAIEQIAAKRPFFYRLPNTNADFPAASLTEASLIDAPHDGPDAGLAGLKRIGRNTPKGTVDHIRTVCPVYKPSMAGALRDFISFRTITELVYDQSTFRKLCRPEQMPMLCAVVAHPYTDVRVYPGELSFGVGTYDDQGMVMAYNDHPGNEAGIITADEELIEWIDGRFEEYWQASQPVGAELTKLLGKYVDESVWSISDVMFWAAEDADETASRRLNDLITR